MGSVTSLPALTWLDRTSLLSSRSTLPTIAVSSSSEILSSVSGSSRTQSLMILGTPREFQDSTWCSRAVLRAAAVAAGVPGVGLAGVLAGSGAQLGQQESDQSRSRTEFVVDANVDL